MRIVFFGSGRFAVGILDQICRLGHDVVLVVTRPDRKKGRHLQLAFTPVKKAALSRNLKILQPEDVNRPSTINQLKGLGCDLFVVVSFGSILSKRVLEIPLKMSINFHASLLPAYRGASPIRRVLIDGRKRTGISVIKMNTKMDQGDILFQKALRVAAGDDAVLLEEKLSKLAVSITGLVLDRLSRGRLRPKKQNAERATYAPLMHKQDGRVRWNETAERVYDRFRGCTGWPASFTTFKGMYLKILKMSIGRRRGRGKPGEVVAIHEDALEVACAQGSIMLTEVLPESHRRMSAKSFLAGHNVKVADVFG